LHLIKFETVIHWHRLGFKRSLLVALASAMALFIGKVCMADNNIHHLPEVMLEADAPLIEALQKRRTLRAFAPRGISLAKVAQLLWAAQGITSPEGFRTAPSAGALYPLELHLVAGDVEGLQAGSYRYNPKHRTLKAETLGDLRPALAQAALNQDWIAQAPVIVVVGAAYSRTTSKYGRRGVRYVHMEVGHATQNLLLQAEAMGLRGATVGAFDGDLLQRLLRLSEEESPLAILPLGYRR